MMGGGFCMSEEILLVVNGGFDGKDEELCR
jgi:hypothetical protein